MALSRQAASSDPDATFIMTVLDRPLAQFNILVNGSSRRTLINTGSLISLINSKWVRKTSIKQCMIKIKSISESEINLLGKTRLNIDIDIKQTNRKSSKLMLSRIYPTNS